MIEYVARSGPSDALNYPIFVCDTCRKQVTERGNVVWGCTLGVPGPRRSTPVFITHKGRCDTAFDRWFEQEYPDGDGWMQLSEEFDVFARQLAHNASKPLPAGGNVRTQQLTFPRPSKETA